MKKLKIKLLPLCFLLSTTINSLNAQSLNLSGQWILKLQESISGKLYDNGVPKKVKVTQSIHNIILEKITSTGNNADIVSNDTLQFDGRSSERFTKSNRRKKISLQWAEDKKSFTTISILYSAKNDTKIDFKIIDNWTLDTLSNLVLIRRVKNFENGEAWESRSEYQKNELHQNF